MYRHPSNWLDVRRLSVSLLASTVRVTSALSLTHQVKTLRHMQGIGLDQHAFQVHPAEHLLECRSLAGFLILVALLRQGDFKSPGENGELGDRL